MLRVGLTGNLGSGKSTVAGLFAARGAYTLSSDAIGRDLMQPGQAVYDQIVDHFGPAVLAPNAALDRAELARLAFAEGRAEELNSIVHPAVIARQAELASDLFTHDAEAVLIVESALIFETRHSAPDERRADWHTRFDRILLVTAPESDKIARFVGRQQSGGQPSPERRQALEAEARRRLALQLPDPVKAPNCDYTLVNDSSLDHLELEVEALWPVLCADSKRRKLL